jgi:hypothetical protein
MPSPQIDALLSIKDHIAAYAVLVQGQFSDEISKLQTLKSDLVELTKTADTVQKIQQLQENADTYCAKKQQEAEAATKAFDDFKDALFGEQQELLVNQKKLAAELRAFNDEKNTFDLQTQATIQKAEDVRLAAEALYAEALTKVDAITLREKAVTDAEVEVKRKLDVLKSL